MERINVAVVGRAFDLMADVASVDGLEPTHFVDPARVGEYVWVNQPDVVIVDETVAAPTIAATLAMAVAARRSRQIAVLVRDVAQLSFFDAVALCETARRGAHVLAAELIAYRHGVAARRFLGRHARPLFYLAGEVQRHLRPGEAHTDPAAVERQAAMVSDALACSLGLAGQQSWLWGARTELSVRRSLAPPCTLDFGTRDGVHIAQHASMRPSNQRGWTIAIGSRTVATLTREESQLALEYWSRRRLGEPGGLVRLTRPFDDGTATRTALAELSAAVVAARQGQARELERAVPLTVVRRLRAIEAASAWPGYPRQVSTLGEPA